MDLPVPIPVLLVHTAINDLDLESYSFSGLRLDLAWLLLDLIQVCYFVLIAFSTTIGKWRCI